LPSVCATMIARVRSRKGRVELGHVDVISRHVDVDEDRHQVVLNDRIDRGRETGGEVITLVAGLESIGPQGR